MNESDLLIIAFDPGTSNDDIPILMVGRQEGSLKLRIINAIIGNEAKELYERLSVK